MLTRRMTSMMNKLVDSPNGHHLITIKQPHCFPKSCDNQQLMTDVTLNESVKCTHQHFQQEQMMEFRTAVGLTPIKVTNFETLTYTIGCDNVAGVYGFN